MNAFEDVLDIVEKWLISTKPDSKHNGGTAAHTLNTSKESNKQRQCWKQPGCISTLPLPTEKKCVTRHGCLPRKISLLVDALQEHTDNGD